MSRTLLRTAAVAFLLCAFAAIGESQTTLAQIASSERGPRFLMTTRRETIPLDVARTPVLRRRVSVSAFEVPLETVLADIARQAGLSLSFSPDVVHLRERITVELKNLTLAAALTEVLIDQRLDVVLSPGGQLSIVRQPGVSIVSGTVTDSTSGRPVAQAQVTVAATTLGATTNERGEYSISGVPSGTRLIAVRRLGYNATSREVVVPDDGVLTVDLLLVATATRLTEVVTTVTGEQRRFEVGSAVGRIAADSLAREAPITRLADILTSRVPGLQISQNSGFSGESPRVRMRGISSVTMARDPLLYVDGVRVDNSTGEILHHVVGFLSYGHIPGRFNDINPEDIESIEVVKGPSAATLYGTDAANGVIVIKTKRGEQGRARWSIYSETGLLKPATEFEPSYYSWGRNTTTNATQRCLLVQQAAGTCTVDSLTRYSPLNDSETSMIGTGERTQLGVQVSGGLERLRYFFSGDFDRERSYLEMPAIDVARISAERGGAPVPDEQIHPNAARKINFRGNVGSGFSDGEVSVSMGYVNSYTRIPRGDEWAASYWGPGYRDAFNGYEAGRGRPGETFALLSAEDAKHFMQSVQAGWRPLEWLSTRATVGYDFSSMQYKGLQRRGEGSGTNRGTGRRLNMRTGIGLTTVDLGASAFTNVGPRISSRSSIGAQYNRKTEEVTFANATGLPPGSETVTGAATLTGGERTAESVVAGMYAEQTFGLNERLFLTAAVRADGGSTFGENFNTAVYPKASLSWIISEEPFVPRLELLESLRLRAAYGASGVQPGSTDALALVNPITSFVDGALVNGAVRAAIGNPNLRPERTREFEAGADVESFNGRLKLELTYYNKLSSDALIDRPLPHSVGILTRRENLGSVRNRGWEALATAVLVDTRPISWDVTLNGSTNHNRLESVNADVTFVTGPSTSIRVGYPLFSRWDPRILSFADANGNGILEQNEVVTADTAVYLGQSHPPRQLGIASGLSFFDERIRVSSQFDYRGGHLGMNFTELNRCNSFSVCRAVNDPTAPLWQQARVIAATRPVRNWAGFMEDASFWRWRELAVTYRAPASIAARMKARDASITLAGRNLKLWTRYTSPDPEVNSSAGSVSTEGPSDNPIAPQTRYWTLRLNLGF